MIIEKNASNTHTSFWHKTMIMFIMGSKCLSALDALKIKGTSTKIKVENVFSAQTMFWS